MKYDSCEFHEFLQSASSTEWQCTEAALKGIPVAVCLVAAGRVAYANPSCLRLLGNENIQEMLGREVTELAAGDSVQELSDLVLNATSASRSVQLRARCGVTVRATAEPLWIGAVSVVQLTFEETPALTPLASKTKELQIIVDRVPALLAYVGRDGRYKWVNRAYEEWYGIAAEAVVGRHWQEYLTERVSAQYVEDLRPAVEQALAGTRLTFESTQLAAGRRIDLRLSYSPDVDATGDVCGFVLLVTDVTEHRRVREALLGSEERFRALAEALPSVVWSATPAGELDYLSDRFREITGRGADESLGTGWNRVIYPDDQSGTLQRWAGALASGRPFETQHRLLQHNGSYRWFLTRAVAQRNPTGEIVRWVGVSTDIHRQVAAEAAIRESERRYRLLFEDNPLPMWTYDTETLRFLSVNDTAVRTYGYSREEFLAMRVADIRPEEDVPSVMPLMKEPMLGQPMGPLRHRRRDGTIFWAEVTAHDTTDGGGTHRLIVAQDISERVRLNEELVRQAQHDPLTGLPNRALLVDRFEQARLRAKRSGKRLAVLTMDIDRLKQVNDTFGHQVGDEFLQASVQRLRARLRKSDTLARVGGDEFVVLAENIDSFDGCVEVAASLIDALRQPVSLRGLELQSTISIGIGVFPEEGDNLDDVLRQADYSLYQAKRAGRNCYRHYNPTQTRGVLEAMQVERAMRSALDTGGFVLHYHPLYSRTGEMEALEALVRLSHPELGLLPPARFIPIAEESGLIHEIGLWVLREACRQIVEWRDDGLDPVPVAVNVSAAQFLRGSLAEEVQRVLQEFDLSPHLLEVELTESLLMENTESFMEQMRLLKELGVRIAIDDFGTGYSSLSYLYSLPLDCLKVDRSFVRKIARGQPNPIVAAIVEMGHNLGLTVVAEGVETQEQRDELVRLKCDRLQGFLFTEPRPAKEIRRFLEQRKLRTAV